MITASTLTISFELPCDFPDCHVFAAPHFRQLHDGNYGRCSVMPIPLSMKRWRETHRTARRRAARCRRRGYRFVIVRPEERADEIWEINTSAPERQGRPMSPGYLERPSDTPDPIYPCLRHAVRRYGVETDKGKLVSYLYIYRLGELALVSQILGHWNHLENEIMYLLFEGALDFESADPSGYVVYNRHDSGRDGLRWFKERIGFEERSVRWAT